MPAPATRAPDRLLGFGPAISVALGGGDRAAVAWLEEFFGPAFGPARGGPDCTVTVSSSAEAYEQLLAGRPADARKRVCFAFDQWFSSLPGWEAGPDLFLDDRRRSALVRVRGREVELLGHPRTRRWRFTLVLLVHEIVAAKLRPERLELHASAVESGGRAVAIAGPKLAGKTTLAFGLLRSGRCRALANDRLFAGEEEGAFVARGVPTAVRIRPGTLIDSPELRRGLAGVERPYLHTIAELERGDSDSPADAELALSPAEVARRLGVERSAAAPLGALVFPEVDTNANGVALTRLGPEEVRDLLLANRYGLVSARDSATVFEELEGGPRGAPAELAQALAEAVPGFRAVLGRDAYAPGFADEFLARVLER
jgi:hypothetical protein